MATISQRLLRKAPPRRFGGSLIGPSMPAYMQQFYDTRMGFGKNVDAGYGTGVDVRIITDNNPATLPTTLAAACAGNAKKWVKFAPSVTVDCIVPNHGSIALGANTILDGYGYAGTVIGAITPKQSDNVVIRYMSATQPFVYNSNPSGPCMDASNSPRTYVDHCTMWDSGDVLWASGAYQLTSGGSGDTPGPYYFSITNSRLGPNPGTYAMMAPLNNTTTPANIIDYGAWTPNTAYADPGNSKVNKVTYNGRTWFTPNAAAATATFDTTQWGSPGFLNGFDNDPRNGKCMNCAYDHNAVSNGAPLAKFDHFAYGTMYHNVMQGCFIRNGKGRSETVDVIANVVAKYGTPYPLNQSQNGGINTGGGSACDDNATVNIEGNVYIPMKTGEKWMNFPDSFADAQGVPRISVGDVSGNKAINAEGTAKTKGNARIGGNYVTGQSVVTSKFSTGFDRSAFYSLTVPDVSSQAAAQVLVTMLEDTAATRAGNPFSTKQPPSWRTVDTTGLF